MNTWIKWHYKKRKRYKQDMGAQIRALLFQTGWKAGQPVEFCFLEVDRFSSGNKLPDWDNLVGGIKPLQDCLVVRHPKVNPHGIGVITDDNPAVVRRLFVLPHQCKKGDEHTDVRISSTDSELQSVIDRQIQQLQADTQRTDEP